MFRNKTITDENKIEILLTKGVDEVIDEGHLRKRLLEGKQLRIKLGIDPTSPNIHLGRAAVLWKLRQFQELGHRAVFIIGDFTARIGDMSDKESERPILSEEEVKKNMKTYLSQAFKILDKNLVEAHYNSKWLSKIGYSEIDEMLELFSLHEFEARENVAKRLTAGKRISLRELLYPLMQGYDSVAVKADVELGGTDQKYNLLAGRTIQKHYNQPSQDIMMIKFPLLGPDGRKMSSSWGNVINITDQPDDMFGKLMSIGDSLIIHYFEMATRLSADMIKEIDHDLRSGKNPKDIKIKLAFEVVSMYHGEQEARRAQEEFKKVFSQKELPEKIEEWILKTGERDIVGVLIDSGLAQSKSEAKTLINQSAVKINDVLVKDWSQTLNGGDIIRVGPRKFLKIIEPR